jgi:putative transposase
MERYRITPDVFLYYCTYTVVDWLPVFVSDAPCQMIADSLRFCQETKSLRVDSVVIMPTHLHLIVYDAEYNADRLTSTLSDFRKFTGRQLVQRCQQSMPPSFVATFREVAGTDRDHRFWQPSRHPVGIETEAFHNQKRDYLHDNPRRKGLVHHPQDWRWSSARYYETGNPTDCDVPLAPVIW